MNDGIELRIETFSIFGLPSETNADAMRQTVEAALRKLSTRLAGSPFERSGVREIALERLSLDTLSADELMSERGAERLADELYLALERGVPR
jgi:hypothetical protein